MSLTSSAQNRVLFEDFSSAQGSKPPPGWKYEMILGNNLYDSFFFENTSYFFAPGIYGNCAFFDVYNGGVKGGSNGDGNSENVFLITPFVTLDTVQNWTMVFDYHLMRVRSPEFSVLWRPDSLASWSKIWVDNSGTTLTVHKEINVIPGSVVRGKGQFAFNWKTSNNALSQGYLAFDNVQIYSKSKVDVGITPHLLNRNLICKNELADILFEVENYGLVNLTTVPVQINVSYPLVDTIIRDTILSLKKNEKIEYRVGKKFKFVSGYKYAVEMISNQSADTLVFNDTGRSAITYLDTIQRPNVLDAERCGKGTVDLFSLTHLNDTTFWYDKSGLLLGKGRKFTTPTLYSNDTFMAKAGVLFQDKINTYQGPFRFSTPSSGGAYIQVVANQHLVINALGQHFFEAGAFKGDVFYKKGGYKGFENDSTVWELVASVDTEAYGWGKYKRIPIDLIEIQKNDTISFYVAITGSSNPTFKRTTLTIDHPAMSVTSDRISSKRFVSGGTLYSNLSWDGEIHFWTVCTSEADTIEIKVISRPKGVKVEANATFNGLFKNGTSIDPDQVSEQGQAAYDVSAPNGASGTSYGKLWGIGAIKVISTGGWIVPDTFYYTVAPMFGEDFKFVFNPKGLMIDSMIRLSFTVFNYTNGCDTFIERFLHVSELPDPWFEHNEVCEGDQLILTNKTISQNELTYNWDFGDGTKATGKDQIKTYNTPGNFNVSLTATNSSGIAASISRMIVVYEKPRPLIEAQFACEGDPIHMEAKRIRSGEKIVWIVDDLLIKDSFSIDHIYDNPGSYTAKLIAFNLGCSDTVIRNVFQFHRPVAQFDYKGRCSYDSFMLTSDVVYLGQGSLGFKWLVDDKLLSTLKNWKGIMPDYGQLPVKLIVASQFQCSDTFESTVVVFPSPIADFDVGLACFDVETKFFNKTRDTSGLNVKYQWSFGDGRFSTELNPVNNYQNAGETLVALRATANNGCSNRKDSLVIVKLKPNANFTFNGGCDGAGVVFTNYSEQSDGPLLYEWDFADGFRSSIHSPVHTFRVEKTTTFNVSLKVYSDVQSCSDIHTEQVTIGVNPSCNFKTIRSDYDRAVWRFEPEELDSQTHSYTWIFVGSGASTDAAPVHRFEYTETQYRVILEVVNSEGCDCLDSSNFIKTSWNVGVSNLSNNGIRVFPNPTSTNINIEFDIASMVIPHLIILTDITGKEVSVAELSEKRAAYSLDIKSYKEGIYFLNCINNDGYKVTIPIIITR